MLKKAISTSFALLLILAISSCSLTRKCNGKKGIKTPMGKMKPQP